LAVVRIQHLSWTAVHIWALTFARMIIVFLAITANWLVLTLTLACVWIKPLRFGTFLVAWTFARTRKWIKRIRLLTFSTMGAGALTCTWVK